MTKKTLLLECAPGEVRLALTEQMSHKADLLVCVLTEKLSLKADLLASVLSEHARVNCPDLRVHRTALLGRDEAGELRPLMEL